MPTVSEGLETTQTCTTFCQEEREALKLENEKLHKEVYRLKKQVGQLKAREKTLQENKVFQADQLKRLNTNAVNKWQDITIQEALKIRYACGVTGYKFILERGWPFPSYRTLCRRISNVPMMFGINSSIIELMEAKSASMPDEYSCVCALSIDEMEISEKLEYDKG